MINNYTREAILPPVVEKHGPAPGRSNGGSIAVWCTCDEKILETPLAPSPVSFQELSGAN